jgi:CSLREA domain-containing protein
MSNARYAPPTPGPPSSRGRRARRLGHLLGSVGLLALMSSGLGCREDAESPTAPEPGGQASSHTPGHKVVNSLADPGNGPCNATQCTLREAITDPQSTEISFASGLTGTITLARPGLGGGTLSIEKTLTITGPSAGVVIQRRSTDPAFRIFRIGSGVTVRLTNLTVRGGKPPGDVVNSAGGIVTFGTLTLANCTVARNAVAGISNHQGTLTLRNSTVAQNSGDGVFNHQGTLTVTNSTVTQNSASGIDNTGGTVALTRSTLSENLGGYHSFAGDATLTEARIVANRAGGIGTTSAGVTLTNSTVARNTGPGINARRGSFISVDKSTIAGNSSAQAGGGIRMFVTLRAGIVVRLTNSTVAFNSAPAGGGIYADGIESDIAATVILTNSTVAFNSATEAAGGIYKISREGSVIQMTNSVVAKNAAPTGPDLLGESFTARFNLVGDGTGSDLTNTEGNQVGKVSPNTTPIDPKLGPLALNGGPTRTFALLAGSPAIDAASTPDCPETDQRGVPRPQGPACDIGSYERE